jgi:D-amino-acid oxidase
MSISVTNAQPIIVLGLGVIGLTTSIRLMEAGYAVIAYASHLPEDPSSLTSCYTSAAAGAHHLSFAGNDDIRQQKLDKRTFDIFAKEEQTGHSGLRKIKQVEFYGKGAGMHIKFFESLPDVCIILLSFVMRSWRDS